MSSIGKSIDKESRLVVARGWRRGEWAVTANGYRVSFWGDENILTLWWYLHNSVNILKTTVLYILN